MNHLQQLWGSITLKYERGMKRLFRSTAMTVEGLSNLITSPLFKKESWVVTAQMVGDVIRNNTGSWIERLKQASNERTLRARFKNNPSDTEVKEVIERLTVQSHNRIRTMPLDVSRHITEYAVNSYIKGKNAEEEIRKLIPHVAATRVQLIARTEVAFVNTELTRFRSEQLGLDWYVWEAHLDSVTRDAHRLMNGVVVNWMAPPSPEELNGETTYGKYHAGMTWNCRCHPVAVLDLNSLTYPVRCFNEGKIELCSKADLERLS